MPTLKDRLRSDLTTALKARDALRTSTIRMALTAVTTAEVAGTSARELSDEEVLAVLVKEAKKRREAAEAYGAAGRSDLADKERGEEAILADYLPAPLTPAEIAAAVNAAITAAGATGPHDMGAVMRQLRPIVQGRADGAVVAAQVKAQLAAL